MKLFSKIDNWLIENIFQRLVDLSQKTGQWWMAQSIIAYCILSVIRFGILDVGGSLLIGAINVTVGALLYWCSRDSAWVEVVGSFSPIRLMFIVFIPFDALIMYTSGNPVNLTLTILMLSFYYFAACEPPRPKKRTVPTNLIGDLNG